ncbi:MAG: flagellar basal-body MS-ring/collar protein FliF [Balneolaceae bacterium]|nr:flagellar basal-body MS-ring/collar protein FliF [Balneolaceae bacterium]
MARIVDEFQNFFSPLSGAQKALFVLFSVGILSLASMLFYWALQPSYSVLFGNLNPEAAQTIVEELKSSNVPYQLDDNGQSIRVPRDQVYDLRLQFAAEGAAGSDYQGYELFDQNTLGMTDFMQRINKKRALEGELSRTVNSLDQVETSRIHIVLPERSAFQESTVDPSASVILNLKQGNRLQEDQIRGIGDLIAGSVEGLNVENVVILDAQGNRISDNVLVSQEMSYGSASMRLRQQTEKYLTSKGQSMLDRVLGPGNSILRVSTQHNFDRLTRESNIIDPESRTVISEEERSSANNDQTQQPVQGQQNEPPEAMTTNQQQDESSVSVTNYDVTRTREQIEREVGELERVSASVLLNYKSEEITNEEGETVTEFVPYSDQEITEIRNTLMGALGIMPQRGDQLIITQTRFQNHFQDPPAEQPFFSDPVSLFELVRWIIMAVVFLVVSVMVYRMTKNFNTAGDNLLGKGEEKQKAMAEKRQKYIEGETDDDGELEEDIYQKKLSGEARKVAEANEMAEEIKGFVDKNSPEAASYVRSMMSGVLSSQNK